MIAEILFWFGLPLLGVVLGYVLAASAREFSLWEFLSGCLCGLSGFVLAAVLISVPTSRMRCVSLLQVYHATAATQAAGRADAKEGITDSLEGAAWRLRVADINSKIAVAKYWNANGFGLWYPDWVDTLEPLR